VEPVEDFANEVSVLDWVVRAQQMHSLALKSPSSDSKALEFMAQQIKALEEGIQYTSYKTHWCQWGRRAWENRLESSLATGNVTVGELKLLLEQLHDSLLNPLPNEWSRKLPECRTVLDLCSVVQEFEAQVPANIFGAASSCSWLTKPDPDGPVIFDGRTIFRNILQQVETKLRRAQHSSSVKRLCDEIPGLPLDLCRQVFYEQNCDVSKTLLALLELF